MANGEFFDKPNRIYAVIPAAWVIPVERIKLPDARSYDIMHIATHRTNGNRLLMAVADNPQGIADFLADYDNPNNFTTLPLAQRANWKLVAFPMEEDDVTDVEVLIKRGLKRLRDADADREYRRQVTLRVQQLEADRIQQAAALKTKMYGE